MWQDYIFIIGMAVFSIALLPSIRSSNKPALGTSVPTAFFQFVFMAAFASLGLWLSAVGGFVLGVLWSILAVQVYRRR